MSASHTALGSVVPLRCFSRSPLGISRYSLVRAQQKAIIVLQLRQLDIEKQIARTADRPRDHVGGLPLLRVLRAQPPLIHLLLSLAVIARELRDPPGSDTDRRGYRPPTG